jgi:phage gp36-like protein
MDITATLLIDRYGAQEIADVAVPTSLKPLTAAQMEQAVAGADLTTWPVDAADSAKQALVRLASSIARATTELAFYLRHRAADAPAPPWLGDDAAELARYHLYDKAGREESTIRLRYQDVIKRLKDLMAEDAARGGSEGDTGGTVQMVSNPRMLSRHSLRNL